jgi:ribonuclease HII
MDPRITYEELVRFDESWKRPPVKHLAGVDEAGRGAIAGPVVAAAVICNPHDKLTRVRDSKLLSEPLREELFEAIRELSLSIGIGIVGPREIDRSNILAATLEAMKAAVGELDIKPCRILVDGNRLPDVAVPAEMVKRGDNKSFSIAAASIVAKVTRDRIMRKIGDDFPRYGFRQNKGYGTERHIEVIRRKGLTECHRKSFKIRSLS